MPWSRTVTAHASNRTVTVDIDDEAYLCVVSKDRSVIVVTSSANYSSSQAVQGQRNLCAKMRI